MPGKSCITKNPACARTIQSFFTQPDMARMICRNRAPAPDTCDPGGILAPNSSQALPQHMNVSAYGCFLPDLTGFTDAHCEGPNCQHCSQVPNPASHNLKQEFNLAIADCELQGTATSPSSTVKLSIDHSEAKRNRLEKVTKISFPVSACLWRNIDVHAVARHVIPDHRFRLILHTRSLNSA